MLPRAVKQDSIFRLSVPVKVLHLGAEAFSRRVVDVGIAIDVYKEEQGEQDSGGEIGYDDTKARVCETR